MIVAKYSSPQKIETGANMDLKFSKVTRKGPITIITLSRPEPRVGLAALAGGVHRLPRQIGLKRAMGMILTARHVSAKEGLELGFVNEVVPAGEALAAAERWAETICKNSPMSIRASKQAIQKGLSVSLEQAIAEQREYPAVKAMAGAQDCIAGPKAFSEKRPPKMLGE